MRTNTLRSGTGCLLIGAFFAIAGAALTARAATLTVTNLNDSGAGSLRQTIADASPGDAINFSVTGTITLASGQLVIDKNLKIQGPGQSLLSISGNNASRVFYVDGGVTTTLDGITIENGFLDRFRSYPEVDGAGIFNNGTLIVNNSYIRSSKTACYACSGHGGGLGGGIFNGGVLTVNNSSVVDNWTYVVCDFKNCGGGFGGGIANAGTLTVSNSSITGNHAECIQLGGNCDPGGSGGGIYNWPGSLTVNNSTISDNFADEFGYGGGGILTSGELAVSNSSVIANTEGIELLAPVTATLNNTIVANNFQGDIFGENVALASHNLISNAASSGGIVNGMNGNIVGFDPMLGPLQNNGGSTLTYALLPGSPAINAGDNVFAIGPSDQRGKGFARIFGGTVDIGSYELQIRRSILQ